MPAPPVPDDHVEMTFLLKKAEYARNVGSPKPDAKDVMATPVNATDWTLANATTMKPPTAMAHDIEIRVLK